MRAALQGAKRVIVIEKDLAVGLGGILASNVRMALRGLPVAVHTVIAGLGGRAITKASLRRVFSEAASPSFAEPHFLDLNWQVVEKELARQAEQRRAGPTAENILRQVNVPGTRVH